MIDNKNNNREKLIRLAKALYTLKIRKLINPIKYFEPQEYQEEFWRSPSKYKFIFGGNRSGKTINGAAYVINKCLNNPNYIVWACTYAKLSVPVQQKKIKELLPRKELKYAKWSEQRGFTHKLIIFKNGSMIRFKTYEEGEEKYQGGDVDLIWNDEECKQEIYNEQLARLIDRNGEIIITMTPINGITWIYTDVLENENINKSIDYWYWETAKNKKISQEGFERIIKNYSQKEAEVRSTGHFVTLNSGRLYYAFDRKINIKKLEVNPSLPLLLSFDFNVNPMTTIISQIVNKENENEQDKVLNVLEVLSTPDANTRLQCQLLQKKLNKWKGKIIIYGDATNTRRTETADVNDTNWTIIKEYFPPSDLIEYKVPNINPNIKERISWTNAKILNFENKTGLYINQSNCKSLIIDLEQGIWHKNGKEKDKSNPMLNHSSDALDYIIAEEFKLNDFEPAYEYDIDNKIYELPTQYMGLKNNKSKIFY